MKLLTELKLIFKEFGLELVGAILGCIIYVAYFYVVLHFIIKYW